MCAKLHFPNQHYLKAEFRKRKIRLWQLRDLTGVSECRLSRYLNGIDPMPAELEQQLWKILESLNRLRLEKDRK